MLICILYVSFAFKLKVSLFLSYLTKCVLWGSISLWYCLLSTVQGVFVLLMMES